MQLNNRYIAYYLDSGVALEQAMKDTQSIGVPDLGIMKIRSFPIPLPPLAEQKRIVAKVDELLARCAGLESKLGQAQVVGRQLTAAVLHGAVG